MLIAQPLTPVPPPPFEPRALQGKHAAPETTGGLILPGGPSQTQVDMFSLVLEGGGGGGPFAFGRSRRRDAILTSVCVARLKPTRSRETRQEFARTNYPRKRVAKPFRPRRASCDRIAHAPRPPLSSSGATQFRFAGPSLISRLRRSLAGASSFVRPALCHWSAASPPQPQQLHCVVRIRSPQPPPPASCS